MNQIPEAPPPATEQVVQDADGTVRFEQQN
jgi:hypothetical protein